MIYRHSTGGSQALRTAVEHQADVTSTPSITQQMKDQCNLIHLQVQGQLRTVVQLKIHFQEQSTGRGTPYLCNCNTCTEAVNRIGFLKGKKRNGYFWPIGASWVPLVFVITTQISSISTK